MKWFLAAIAFLQVGGSFVYLTLGDLMAAFKGRYPLKDQPWDPDT